ncbi:MAG TPA: FAD-dependent monooxygenase [Candidatus Acidoferrales bacterium]|nr:FAD-dependent monooxygenase [Candidatus Acidoferrales bacterium]
MRRDFDVFVIGGGPAGLAAAIAARKRGFRVGLADISRPPIDKACGEGLLPATLAALRKLGVHLGDEDGYVFDAIRFTDSQYTVAASFAPEFAFGVRRTVLHQRMVECAADCGVEFFWGTRVTRRAEFAVSASGGTYGARWIIGADGGNSRVRQSAGMGSCVMQFRRFGFRQHYRVRPWSKSVEVYWADAAQVYVTPIGESEICLASVSRSPAVRVAEVAAHFPQLLARLRDAQPSSSEKGAVTAMHRLRRVFRGNVALIGDASGGVDAITGDGICLSLHQAVALAEALTRNDLRFYQREHRRLSRVPTWMGLQLLSMDGRPWLRRRVFSALSAHPQLFGRLLSAHVGQASFSDCIKTGAALGLRLLAATA